MATLSPIPQPPTIPFLGNATLIDKEVPLKSFTLLAQQYGEIYQFAYPDGSIVLHLNAHSLVSQVSDDKKFRKLLSRPLEEVRNMLGDGLFSGRGDEMNWGVAHRILMPAFGIGNVVNMYDDMKDICGQLLLKWERFGPDYVFDPSEDFTRLTLDTIAFCSMSYRFNSFYELNMPKFAQELVNALVESSNRAYRPKLATKVPFLYSKQDEKYFSEIKEMADIAAEIIRKRKEHPVEKNDLLNLMLSGKDPKTGQGLSDENIMNNLLTFLAAGHETTSGMLTFVTYYLLKNPEKLVKLREELDRVIGDDDVRLEHLNKCEYMIAIMRETLRLTPSAPNRSCAPYEDIELVGGDGDPNNPANKKYFVKKDTLLTIHADLMMKDPLVWGEDAEVFRPERMMGGAFEKLPYQAWQPFGYGLRACIGRPFAWQEAQLVLASVFHKFDVFLADPGYTLRLKQTLTIKPKGLHIRVAPRAKYNGVPLPIAPSGVVSQPTQTLSNTTPKSEGAGAYTPLYILYGSNTGTCESFAQKLTSNALVHGFKASLSTLDSATNHLPTDGPIVIVTASFEGEPADNAALFVSWLSSLDTAGKVLKDIKFAVFGCGNREWSRTYQRIPTIIDDALEKNGAERLLQRGEADASSVSFFSSFEDYEVALWKTLGDIYGAVRKLSTFEEDGFGIEVVDAGIGRAKLLRQSDAGMGKVVDNKLLTKPGSPAKRHIGSCFSYCAHQMIGIDLAKELALPEGMTYRAGDYLALLPTNPKANVQRVLARFGLSADEEIIIKSETPTTFPVNTPIHVVQLLSGYVELSQPAAKQDIATFQLAAKSEAAAALLTDLSKKYEEEVLLKRLSCIDLLEMYPEVEIPFAKFLRMLPPMRVRQYSISSSPLANPTHATLTVSIIDAPALSGRRDSGFNLDSAEDPFHYLGVASSYLASLRPGDLVPLNVRPSAAAFHLPADPSVPIVMFCAGTGLAPFRGFIQERAEQKKAGRDVGKTVLFLGCRNPDEDYLYMMSDEGLQGEMKLWAELGVVDIRPAFSRKPDDSHGCKYVQDRIWHDHKLVEEMYRSGARASNGVKKACVDTIKDVHPDYNNDEALDRFESVLKERFRSLRIPMSFQMDGGSNVR
ncbi:cytochrome P450 oxidoreductase OrdA-like protein [Schizopora paradoxa]|uniref:Cytochrome P450 oxidoreductase OrdA-like protein n=1 Tax=Schizopora paradoxa TaxID=27342 RepID=A0A0H2SCW6_9AGAM|nr:cytochrome P450 oxidoreductase OrdA-like protein [Schizopora paradoxa]